MIFVQQVLIFRDSIVSSPKQTKYSSYINMNNNIIIIVDANIFCCKLHCYDMMVEMPLEAEFGPVSSQVWLQSSISIVISKTSRLRNLQMITSMGAFVEVLCTGPACLMMYTLYFQNGYLKDLGIKIFYDNAATRAQNMLIFVLPTLSKEREANNNNSDYKQRDLEHLPLFCMNPFVN